jgi:hypothetical protein
MAAMKSGQPKSILCSSAKNVSKRLAFAEEISYSACKGYQQKSAKSRPPVFPETVQLFLTEYSPKIKFGTTKPFSCVQQKVVVEDGVDSAIQKTINLSPTVSGMDTDEQINGDEFEAMINDMADKVWKCNRCLSLSHETLDCTNEIRCRACYRYGHIKRNCLLSKAHEGIKWVQKSAPESKSDTPTFPNIAAAAVPVPIRDKSIHKQSSSSVSNPVSPPPHPSFEQQSVPAAQVPGVQAMRDKGMAVFEVDPAPWLPWGHQIIDGGDTRLPRSYYYAPQDPPQRHQSYYIAVIDPPPPPQDGALWRQQVSNFLTGPLQRHVIEVQPSILGVGLFQLNSPNAASALVQHGQFQLPQANRFVRFFHADDAEVNHRAVQGFRRGWLMFLGNRQIIAMTWILLMRCPPLASFITGISMTLFWNAL